MSRRGDKRSRGGSAGQGLLRHPPRLSDVSGVCRCAPQPPLKSRECREYGSGEGYRKMAVGERGSWAGSINFILIAQVSRFTQCYQIPGATGMRSISEPRLCTRARSARLSKFALEWERENTPQRTLPHFAPPLELEGSLGRGDISISCMVGWYGPRGSYLPT